MLFFGIIGFGVFLYGCFYTLASVIFDCDVRLGFLDKFGKSPRRLKGKVAFITGASSGIGEHTAYALAKAGVKLVLTARRSLELQRVKQQCIGRSQRANWENIDITVDRQMFELNVFAVVNLSRVALEHFNKRGQGHLAVVSSLAGILGAPFSGSYTGAKHAIHGYFNGLRAEKLGTQIHVTLLCPGPTFTNFLAEAFTDKDGEKHHGSTKPTDKRMTAERCGHLNAVAIVNKVGEAWMGLFPLMPMVYVSIYFPNLYSLGMRILGPQYLYKLRDSKEYTGFTEMSKTE
ncbi:dehydrogenase/reductase SDR family member 7 isoform X3 [Anthonomus grandis grandis]|uniref:dehydrogenase/reductase SDR family member 7 isoform X3 n=1 Tax=Anthonomus grandis grandis TaxID=2921223 RepID=UPI00216536D8|nr:dehydrogenase/reductase SDR family member 7 isoform X3 [Anthonomus grandis grandis]